MPDRNPSHDLDPLILDLVEGIAKSPRTYADVMDVWRTSCPRLTVWEDAVERGFVERVRRDGATVVEVSAEGWRFLRKHGRRIAA